MEQPGVMKYLFPACSRANGSLLSNLLGRELLEIHFIDAARDRLQIRLRASAMETGGHSR
jgi:hypothetical protein